MKLIACVLVILSSVWIGLSFASHFRQRTRFLLAFADSLSILQNEICTRLVPLPEAFRQTAEVSVRTRPFFDRLNAGLDAQLPFSEVWDAAVRSVPSLRAEDRHALQVLGAQLGRFDAETQQRALSECIEILRDHAAENAASDRDNAKLSVCLGAACGVLLAVTLY